MKLAAKRGRQPESIWFSAVARKELGIYDISIYSECFRSWRKYKKALLKLFRAGLIEPVPERWSSFYHIGLEDIALTDKGRSIAKRLLAEEDAESDVQKAVETLKKQGTTPFTLTQLRDLLWQISGEKFRGKEEFEAFWTKQKLGRILKKYAKGMVVRQGLKTVRLYFVTETALNGSEL
jgi:hypothetical protein